MKLLLESALRCLAKVKSAFSRKHVVVVIGGSAGARIATEIFRTRYSQEVFILETFAKNDSWGSTKPPRLLLGTIDDNVLFLKQKNVHYFVATGDNHLRQRISMKLLKTIGKPPVNCIHEHAFISSSASIGHGNLILANSVIHTNATVGNGTIINCASVVEHDAEVHDFAQIAPAAVLGGRVIIHELAFVGLGAQILPEISVGENSVVAAGATVIRNVDANTMVAGCPAVMKKKRD